MAYRIDPALPPIDAFRAIGMAEIHSALQEIDNDSVDGDTTVHQVRKRCKKLRGLARLYRKPLEKTDSFRSLNDHFRDLARTLSAGRDTKAVLEAHDSLVAAYGDRDIAPIGVWLRRRKDLLGPTPDDLREGLAAARAGMEKGRVFFTEADIPGTYVRNHEKAIRAGFRKTYARARRGIERAFAGAADEHFHEWRKRAKYHWYHCRLTVDLWPAQIKPRVEAADRLAELLGDDHDLAVLATLLTGEDGPLDTRSRDACLTLIARRRTALKAEAGRIGAALFHRKPSDFLDRLRRGLPVDAEIETAGAPGGT